MKPADPHRVRGSAGGSVAGCRSPVHRPSRAAFKPVSCLRFPARALLIDPLLTQTRVFGLFLDPAAGDSAEGGNRNYRYHKHLAELGRGGLEPPTHGFSVRCSTN